MQSQLNKRITLPAAIKSEAEKVYINENFLLIVCYDITCSSCYKNAVRIDLKLFQTGFLLTCYE